MNLNFLFNKFFNGINELILRVRAFNYSDRSTGLRTPDCPVGLLNSDQGNTQLFAGVNKVVVDLEDGVVVQSKNMMVDSHEIHFEPNSLEDLTILGEHFNPAIWDPNVKLFSTTMDLSKFFLVTIDTKVVNGKLVNIIPLTSVVKPVSLVGSKTFLPSTKTTSAVAIAKTVGINIPIIP